MSDNLLDNLNEDTQLYLRNHDLLDPNKLINHVIDKLKHVEENESLNNRIKVLTKQLAEVERRLDEATLDI